MIDESNLSGTNVDINSTYIKAINEHKEYTGLQKEVITKREVINRRESETLSIEESPNPSHYLSHSPINNTIIKELDSESTTLNEVKDNVLNDLLVNMTFKNLKEDEQVNLLSLKYNKSNGITSNSSDIKSLSDIESYIALKREQDDIANNSMIEEFIKDKEGNNEVMANSEFKIENTNAKDESLEPKSETTNNQEGNIVLSAKVIFSKGESNNEAINKDSIVNSVVREKQSTEINTKHKNNVNVRRNGYAKYSNGDKINFLVLVSKVGWKEAASKMNLPLTTAKVWIKKDEKLRTIHKSYKQLLIGNLIN